MAAFPRLENCLTLFHPISPFGMQISPACTTRFRSRRNISVCDTNARARSSVHASKPTDKSPAQRLRRLSLIQNASLLWLIRNPRDFADICPSPVLAQLYCRRSSEFNCSSLSQPLGCERISRRSRNPAGLAARDPRTLRALL